MKIIVISGSHSSIGKTTLLRNIQAHLPPASTIAVKLGHRSFNAEKPEKFFSNMPEGLKYIESLIKSGSTDYLLIESNSIFNYVVPDLGIFLQSEGKPEKESASLAKSKADIIIDKSFDCDAAVKIIYEKTGVELPVDVLLYSYKYIYD